MKFLDTSVDSIPVSIIKPSKIESILAHNHKLRNCPKGLDNAYNIVLLYPLS